MDEETDKIVSNSLEKEGGKGGQVEGREGERKRDEGNGMKRR